MRRLLPIVVVLLTALSVLYTGCRSKPRNPEAEIEAFIDHFEVLAEEKNLSEIKALIDGDYQDGRGFNKRRVISFIQLQFLKRSAVHVASKVLDLEVDEQGENATVSILSAVARRPLDGFSGLKNARAQLMRFRLRLVYDGDWKVARADWSKARLSDFLERLDD